MIVYGDFNARGTSWGDSTLNPRGRTLADYVEKHDQVLLHSAGCNTFLSPGGGSCIDLSLSFGYVQSCLDEPWVEHCYTLFTGAPQRGHIPVLQNIRLQPSTKETRRTAPDFESADWGSWHSSLKKKLRESENIEDPQEMLRHFLTLIKAACDEHIPTKIVCKHSKPYWSDTLSEKSTNLQKAQKRFKKHSDPTNRTILEDCKTNFKDALIAEKTTGSIGS